jgi:RNA polymerase sigma-70 factor (ECF subfamily)
VVAPLSADEALQDAVRRLRAGGDAEEWSAVLDARLRPRLLAYFRADPGSREDAEDLAQQTLARVLQGVGRLRAEESFMAWLFTIARNVRCTALGQRRRASRVVAGGIDMAGDPPDPRPTALEEGLEDERLAALRAAIGELPRQQKQCFLLRVDMELSYEDVAATLGLSVLTVRNHLALARKSLRRVFAAGARDVGWP